MQVESVARNVTGGRENVGPMGSATLKTPFEGFGTSAIGNSGSQYD